MELVFYSVDDTKIIVLPHVASATPMTLKCLIGIVDSVNFPPIDLI